MIKIAASILSADFARLGEQVHEAEQAGADYIHVDVMDGHFVPNITMGPVVVRAIRHVTRLPFDVHLMIESPEQYVAEFAAAGADIITVQQEACRHLHRVVEQIKALGKRAGVAINPATPTSTLQEILPFIDLVLVMTVNPGFGGQSFIETMPNKIAAMRDMIDTRRLGVELEVDGGIHAETAGKALSAGRARLGRRVRRVRKPGRDPARHSRNCRKASRKPASVMQCESQRLDDEMLALHCKRIDGRFGSIGQPETERTRSRQAIVLFNVRRHLAQMFIFCLRPWYTRERFVIFGIKRRLTACFE